MTNYKEALKEYVEGYILAQLPFEDNEPISTTGLRISTEIGAELLLPMLVECLEVLEYIKENESWMDDITYCVHAERVVDKIKTKIGVE